MTKQELQELLMLALSNKSLLNEKHDPNKLEFVWPKKRSVISHEVAANLFHFIDSGLEKVFEYSNNEGKYFEIVPSPEYVFASSGVAGYSQLPTEVFDRIIAVNGKSQSWHIYGEDSKVIKRNILNGKLWDKNELL